MRRKFYNALVNRHAGISYRYHKVHDGTGPCGKVLSWTYLLWINFCYYVLFCRFLGEIPQGRIYEEKKLPKGGAESVQYSVRDWADRLATYDVISFDIFDTLILRGFSQPQDLFFAVGDALGVLDFARIRAEMEQKARQAFFRNSGSYEIGLEHIWEMMAKEVGLDAGYGMELEKEAELKFCYANPFMKAVYQELLKAGKRIVITSDMYLSSGFLQTLLEKCGYTGFEKIFVSCEYKKNKYDGGLYDVLKEWLCSPGGQEGLRIAHVGDNPKSDVKMAKEAGFDSFYYENVNSRTAMYRSCDMSPIVGGAYRGVVNSRLYCGLSKYSPEYEYGYIYGGLFVYGYCSFIRKYCRNNGIDRILFLSRDGDILKKAYNLLYPDDDTVYAYWSRKAATKLLSNWNRYDYYRRFLYHKVNQNITVEEALAAMGLTNLLQPFMEYCAERQGEMHCITADNVGVLKDFLQEHWKQVQDIYADEQAGAKIYYDAIMEGHRRVAAVDIGWAGSGAVALDYLCSRVWNIGEVVGIVAGTNTVYNAEPYASETFLQNGGLVSYLYSQSHNRDLLKKHNPNKNYNIYWELLLASPTPQFDGFAYNREKNTYELKFGRAEENIGGIEQIQQGILDFVRDYKALFGGMPLYENIGGRDAYAPMLVAASHKERYLRQIAKQFNLEINV